MPTISNYKNSNIIYNKIAASINTFILKVGYVVSWRIHIIYRIFWTQSVARYYDLLNQFFACFIRKTLNLSLNFVVQKWYLSQPKELGVTKSIIKWNCHQLNRSYISCACISFLSCAYIQLVHCFDWCWLTTSKTLETINNWIFRANIKCVYRTLESQMKITIISKLANIFSVL